MEHGRFTGRPASPAPPTFVPPPAAPGLPSRAAAPASRRAPALPRVLLALLLGLLAALAPAQRDPGGGPGGGLALESVSGGYSDDGYGAYPYSYSSDAGAYGGYGHAGLYADCDGEIAYTYRWQGPGDPPTQAVVHLRSDASLDGDSGDACDDGLGDPMVVGGHPGEYLASSQGERYRLMSLDGDTLTVRIHPYSQSSRDASVWVSVDAAPITISIMGAQTTNDYGEPQGGA